MYFRCCGYHYYEGNFNHFEQVAAGPQTGRSSPQNHLKKANSGWPPAHRTVAVYHRTSGRWRPPIAVGKDWHIYISHGAAPHLAEKAHKILSAVFPEAIFEVLPLSPAFITQGGPECVAVQIIHD